MVEWHFLGDAERVLTAKGVKVDLDEVAGALDGTDLADTAVKQELKKRHWRTSEPVWEGAKYSYDGFKDSVAVEAVGPGTSNGRAITYGLVKMELGRQRPVCVEVGVLIVSTKTKNPKKKPHFDEAKEFAQRLREAGILRVPAAILGIDTRRGRVR